MHICIYDYNTIEKAKDVEEDSDYIWDVEVKYNPKDAYTFASASLDRSIKVWGLGSAVPHNALEGHEQGVNCVDYYPSCGKTDDHTV
eukprot:6550668-Ditylum_brightwellii.AAC.1